MASRPLDISKPRNATILRERQIARRVQDKPLNGDFVEMLDGTVRRFTYNWGDSIQTTVKNYSDAYSASFYLCSNGDADFSGSLDSGIPIDKLVLTDKLKMGNFWIFDEGIPGGGRGRHFGLMCKVWKETK